MRELNNCDYLHRTVLKNFKSLYIEESIFTDSFLFFSPKNEHPGNLPAWDTKEKPSGHLKASSIKSN